MKIGIDGTGLLLPSAGVKTYLHYWIASMAAATVRSGDTIRIYPFSPATSPGILDHRKAAGTSLSAYLRLNLVRFVNIRGNPALDYIVRGIDLFHCSQHMARRPRRRTTTSTIFDLSCWTVPETHTPANVTATKRYGEKILRTSDGLIAISASARNDAVDILRIPSERIHVIYPGVAEPYFEVTREQADAVAKKYHLNSPYLLFVGCIEPRKNVPNIILAHRRLAESLRRDIQLVLAGPFGWASEETRTMLTAGNETARYLGYVPEADLPGLVRGSVALVYPSYYEGFGLPAAQAMAAGVPVIASNRSSLPEVVGGGGLLVDPDSVEELSHAMTRLISCSDLRSELGIRGRSRANAYRWSECAVQSIEFFRRVANVTT
jgi:alpha-1,3-rhamnosyl/mannosyltransferase